MRPKKIAVIGNACSGKTTLSRRLAAVHALPLIHVDSIQFLPGMKRRDPNDTRERLVAVAGGPEWIIDGFGPLKIIESRFQRADLVVFIRLPLWRTYWWCLKRQVAGLFRRRPELPAGCFESTLPQTLKLISTIWNVHRGLWPQLDRIFREDIYRGKILYIRDLKQLERLSRSGF